MLLHEQGNPSKRDLTSRTRPARPWQEDGFTLVELLVVIVILGILSAVVVFAVRGAGDKGEANARATDGRIIRTAQEAFCARFGQYGTEKQLAGIDEPAPGVQPTKFLSEESKYNDIRAAGVDESKPCNGTGYVIEPVNAGPATTGPATTGPATTGPSSLRQEDRSR
ncbi:MAG: type II secretion system protein [Acidimicrobiales bacterium]